MNDDTLLTGGDGQGNTDASGTQGQQGAGGTNTGEQGTEGKQADGTQASADGQTAGDKGEGTEGKQADGEKTDDKGEVPEAYEFTMPDGVELDTVAADEFSTIAKDLKLSKEQANSIAQVGAKMVQRQIEQHRATVAGWVEALKSDAEIGGEKLTENAAVARQAVEAYGSQELKDVLNMTGLGNHPAVVKAFYKIGKTLKQDSVERGGMPGGTKDPAKTMFPNMN